MESRLPVTVLRRHRVQMLVNTLLLEVLYDMLPAIATDHPL